jgi:hypothetical protein
MNLFRSLNLAAAIRENRAAHEELAAALRELRETCPHTVPTYIQTSAGITMRVVPVRPGRGR